MSPSLTLLWSTFHSLRAQCLWEGQPHFSRATQPSAAEGVCACSEVDIVTKGAKLDNISLFVLLVNHDMCKYWVVMGVFGSRKCWQFVVMFTLVLSCFRGQHTCKGKSEYFINFIVSRDVNFHSSIFL